MSKEKNQRTRKTKRKDTTNTKKKVKRNKNIKLFANVGPGGSKLHHGYAQECVCFSTFFKPRHVCLFQFEKPYRPSGVQAMKLRTLEAKWFLFLCFLSLPHTSILFPSTLVNKNLQLWKNQKYGYLAKHYDQPSYGMKGCMVLCKFDESTDESADEDEEHDHIPKEVFSLAFIGVVEKIHLNEKWGIFVVSFFTKTITKEQKQRLVPTAKLMFWRFDKEEWGIWKEKWEDAKTRIRFLTESEVKQFGKVNVRIFFFENVFLKRFFLQQLENVQTTLAKWMSDRKNK